MGRDEDVWMPLARGVADLPQATIASEEAMRRVLGLARSVARTPSTVLLLGESGVGKEVLARFIHEHSPRADAPFIGINCAALTSSLLESELFGHEKGAFSGAIARHIGIFERAHGGTILLDEVSEVPLETQAKLLRVVQERAMTRVGGEEEIELDIRIVATTNRDLKAAVEAGTFRQDLFYRLNVFPLRVPPLRERLGDIEALALYYLGMFADQFGSLAHSITPEALTQLRSYEFPGNVRELVNICERAIILAGDDEVIREEHLLLDPDALSVTALAEDDGLGFEVDVDRPRAPQVAFTPGDDQLTDVRRKIVLATLERFEGNRTRTAEALGVSIRTLRNKLRDYRELGESVPDPDGSGGAGGA